MATWRQMFEHLSEGNRQQVELWKAGERNHQMVMSSMEAISNFFREYEAAGQPERDEEMP